MRLKDILEKHRKWLNGEDGGERANLSGAILSGANLWRANLRDAILSGANLSGASLSGANLSEANLSEANLSGANLSGAILRDAILYGAILSGANLYRANLSGANLKDARLLHFQIPQEGQLTVWKAGRNGAIIKLQIPSKAKRTATLVGRKCRAEYAKVLAIWDRNGKTIDSCKCWNTNYDFVYRVGETVTPDSYDDDIRVECTSGIHFFLTKEEAEEWTC